MQREYEPLMQELLRLLREEFGDRVRSLLVFGSVARGTARPDSDVDVCVVIRELPVSR
jgi:predicted nucleotidyltransferase